MTEQEVKVRQAVSHVQAAFPSGGGSWAKSRFEAWVAAVEDLDADSVAEAARLLVREWADARGRTPLPGHLRERATAVIRANGKRPRPAQQDHVAVDAGALRDAVAYLEAARTEEDRQFAREQVKEIRSRLRGAGVDPQRVVAVAPDKPAFVQAAHAHRDPPGTIRYVAVQPDGTRVPKGARLAGEV